MPGSLEVKESLLSILEQSNKQCSIPLRSHFVGRLNYFSMFTAERYWFYTINDSMFRSKERLVNGIFALDVRETHVVSHIALALINVAQQIKRAYR